MTSRPSARATCEGRRPWPQHEAMARNPPVCSASTSGTMQGSHQTFSATSTIAASRSGWSHIVGTRRQGRIDERIDALQQAVEVVVHRLPRLRDVLRRARLRQHRYDDAEHLSYVVQQLEAEPSRIEDR